LDAPKDIRASSDVYCAKYKHSLLLLLSSQAPKNLLLITSAHTYRLLAF